MLPSCSRIWELPSRQPDAGGGGGDGGGGEGGGDGGGGEGGGDGDPLGSKH